MNLHAIKAIYRFELARWFRTLAQSILAPVISTSLYFVVFGAVIDARLAGLISAVIALILRAPFLVVVLVAAVTAALLRSAGLAT